MVEHIKTGLLGIVVYVLLVMIAWFTKEMWVAMSRKKSQSIDLKKDVELVSGSYRTPAVEKEIKPKPPGIDLKKMFNWKSIKRPAYISLAICLAPIAIIPLIKFIHNHEWFDDNYGYTKAYVDKTKCPDKHNKATDVNEHYIVIEAFNNSRYRKMIDGRYSFEYKRVGHSKGGRDIEGVYDDIIEPRTSKVVNCHQVVTDNPIETYSFTLGRINIYNFE
jgi:hypothetical protein